LDLENMLADIDLYLVPANLGLCI